VVFEDSENTIPVIDRAGQLFLRTKNGIPGGINIYVEKHTQIEQLSTLTHLAFFKISSFLKNLAKFFILFSTLALAPSLSDPLSLKKVG
jgi:hypothetical protein